MELRESTWREASGEGILALDIHPVRVYLGFTVRIGIILSFPVTGEDRGYSSSGRSSWQPHGWAPGDCELLPHVVLNPLN